MKSCNHNEDHHQQRLHPIPIVITDPLCSLCKLNLNGTWSSLSVNQELHTVKTLVTDANTNTNTNTNANTNTNTYYEFIVLPLHLVFSLCKSSGAVTTVVANANENTISNTNTHTYVNTNVGTNSYQRSIVFPLQTES